MAIFTSDKVCFKTKDIVQDKEGHYIMKKEQSSKRWPKNDTLGHMDLTDIFREFHPKTAEYTFFSSAHGTFSRIDHMLGHTSQYI